MKMENVDFEFEFSWFWRYDGHVGGWDDSDDNDYKNVVTVSSDRSSVLLCHESQTLLYFTLANATVSQQLL